jgi:hypothetical protein
MTDLKGSAVRYEMAVYPPGDFLGNRDSPVTTIDRSDGGLKHIVVVSPQTSDYIALIIEMPSTRIAVVTGASSGIGRAAAIALNAAGWTVVVTARREDSLRETVSLMPQDSRHKSRIICGDMMKVDDIRDLFTKIKIEYGVYI